VGDATGEIEGLSSYGGTAVSTFNKRFFGGRPLFLFKGVLLSAEYVETTIGSDDAVIGFFVIRDDEDFVDDAVKIFAEEMFVVVVVVFPPFTGLCCCDRGGS
jgi:hypothetical protein